MSRRSQDGSEPDLIAYDSASILPPAAGSNYSYGPAMSASSTISLSSSNQGGNSRPGMPQHVSHGSSDFSNRSRARAASLAAVRVGGAGLPVYSPSGHEKQARHSDDEEEDDDEDDDDDEGSDLERDTLNKNSNGRGGWRMLHLDDADYPGSPASSSPIKASSRAARSQAAAHARSPSSASMSSFSSREKALHHAKRTHSPSASMNGGSSMGKTAPYSRFEKFDAAEWATMAIAMILVSFLTAVSLYICFT